MSKTTRTSIMRARAAKYLANGLLACAAAVLLAVPIFAQTVTVTLVGAGTLPTARETTTRPQPSCSVAR